MLVPTENKTKIIYMYLYIHKFISCLLKISVTNTVSSKTNIRYHVTPSFMFYTSHFLLVDLTTEEKSRKKFELKSLPPKNANGIKE